MKIWIKSTVPSTVSRAAAKLLILVASAAALVPNLHADTATWFPEDGVWSDATHWSGGIVPNNDSPVEGTVWDVTLPAFIPQSFGPSLGYVLVDSPITVRDLLLDSAPNDPGATFYVIEINSSLTVTRNLQMVGSSEISGSGTLYHEGNSAIERTGGNDYGPSTDFMGELTVQNSGTLSYDAYSMVAFHQEASYHGLTGSSLTFGVSAEQRFKNLIVDSGATLATTAGTEPTFIQPLQTLALHGTL